MQTSIREIGIWELERKLSDEVLNLHSKERFAI